MAQISIESKRVALSGYWYRHLYLVFRDDTGAETVIRGGLGILNSPGDIVLQINVPLAESEDARGDDTPQARGSRVLNLGGRNAIDVWQIMQQQAANIAAAHLGYGAFSQNSNSVVTSVLNALGITSELSLPANTALGDFPAIVNRLDISTTLLGGAGADVIEGWTQNDTLFGFGGNDRLVGNGGSDRLYGGDDADTLIGGTGNDILIGGDGEDTYVINTGDGNDQIIDSDHSILKRDGVVFTGVFRQIGNSNTYELVTDDQVEIAINSPATLDFGNGDSITFEDLTTVDLVNQELAGIRLIQAATTPTTTLTITGDITPTDIDPSTPGIQAQGDARGSPIGTSQPYGDILGGSDGNDHILAGELNDDVGGGAGDDWIEGGNGNDYLGGRTGDDLIEGGAGKDLLFGESGDDQLYADTRIDIATAIANGDSDTGSGQKGDWLSGNAGDDTLVAGADNDVLTGGGGADLLVAGAGDDYILGDADYYAQYIPEDTPRYSISGTDWYHSSAETFDWTVTIDQDGTAHFYPVVGETDPADSGADVIYAGAGADRVWAGAGSNKRGSETNCF